MMPKSVLFLIPLCAFLAGCAANPAETATLSTEAQAPVAAVLDEPAVLVDHRVLLLGAEFDVLCRQGGGLVLERLPPLILPGTASIEIAIDPGTYTAVQVGYAIDEGDIAWLPSVTGTASLRTLDVPKETFETGGPRWTFHYQLNLPVAEQECYTGAGGGPRSIVITALPAG